MHHCKAVGLGVLINALTDEPNFQFQTREPQSVAELEGVFITGRSKNRAATLACKHSWVFIPDKCLVCTCWFVCHQSRNRKDRNHDTINSSL